MIDYDKSTLFWSFKKNDSPKTSLIPKIIHQLWIGPKKPPYNLMRTWKVLNPTWEYIFWDEKKLSILKFLNQTKIDKMQEWNGKCDMYRYEILYKFGGFFIDADSVCLKPLEDFLFEYENIAVYENEIVRGDLVACGFMGCHPKSCLMQDCIENLINIQSPAWWYVGPAYFTHIIQQKNHSIKIHPSKLFIPNHYSKNGDLKEAYADHLWGNTKQCYNQITCPIPTQTSQLRQKLLLQYHTCRRMGILSQNL